MKRVLLLAFGLALMAGTAGAQGFIRYTPPQFLSCASGVFCLPTGTTSVRLYNGSNAEYGEVSWVANVFTIQTIQNGGTTRNIGLTSATSFLVLSSHLAAGTTDQYTLGYASGANYWKDLFLSRSIQGSKAKSLTDAAAATAFVTIAVPTNSQIGGELIWTATSSAAAVRFVANGSIRFWGTDEGGTPVCGINKIGTDGEGHSSGAATLVCTWTNVVATTNCALSVTCTNSTVGTDPVTINGRLDMPTIATATFN